MYLCPEDDSQMGSSSTGCTSPRSVSSLDEGKGESSSMFDSKSALDAASRTPERRIRTIASRSQVNLRHDESAGMKFAFIAEDDDLGTMGSSSQKAFSDLSEGFGSESSGQSKAQVTTPSKVVSAFHSLRRNVSPHIVSSSNSSPISGSLPFLPLEPPLSEEDYNFALEASEGITDLFDEDLLLNSSN